MKTGKKLLSALLSLVMLISLMSGAFSAAAADGAFTGADALEAGREYLIVTEYDGRYYALELAAGSGNGTAPGAAEVSVSGDTVADAPQTAVWLPDGEGHLQSKANPGMYIFTGSADGATGFCSWEGPGTYYRTAVYDGASKTVRLHTKYWMTFDGTQFYRSDDEADACRVLLFARTADGAADTGSGDAEAAEEVVYPKPETVRRSAVKNADGSITLAFTSDVHYDGVNLNLKTWLENSDIGYIDAFGFCGDMGSAYATGPEDYWTWTGEIMAYMDGLKAEGKLGNAVYTLGNHEWAARYGGNYSAVYNDYEAAGRMMQLGEGIVTDDYVIYCFGAGSIVATEYKNDYTQEDIDELDAWLETVPEGVPVFILTHFPLHNWYGGRYAAHAGALIDVLNEHSAERQIVLLWGHNHSEFDDGYYTPRFPGDQIVIDPEGTVRTLNFICLAAGCTSDKEYTGPSYGSASVMNKGLVVTINADKTLDFSYRTIDGRKMSVKDGQWLVRARIGYGSYDTFANLYVEDGSIPESVEPPEIDGYTFSGWYYWNDYAEVPFDFSLPVGRNYFITAKYDKIIKPVSEAAELDPAYVYVTVQDEQATAVGKSGAPILLYPVPYAEGMTVGDAFIKVHELEYESGADGAETYDTGYGFASFKKLWGHTPQNGSLCFDPTQEKCWIDADAAAVPGGCYYALAYDSSWKSTSAMYPAKAEAEVGETLTLCAKTFSMDASYNYTAAGFSGDVYCAAAFDSVTDTGIDADEGYFDISFNAPGTYYLVVKGSVGEAAGIVTVTKPSCIVSNQAVTLDGEEVEIDHYNVNGNNYFKLRDLACILSGTAYQYGVDYDSEARTVILTTGESYAALDTDMKPG
ncbi:MAG: metallophosphoesterase, partial [Oscillospiraceae bacterium]|nr:metallophosphoesterase [Oscillospiraceae bacterium]